MTVCSSERNTILRLEFKYVVSTVYKIVVTPRKSFLTTASENAKTNLNPKINVKIILLALSKTCEKEKKRKKNFR